MGGADGAIGRGPSPEVVGLAAVLAAIVGLGSVWILTRRRRPPAPAPVAARAAAAPAAETWTNLRLDDNEALPSWLRAIAEPERAPSSPSSPLFSMEPPRPAELDLEHEHLARPARTFADSLEPGAMRLAIAADQTDLLDQPGDLGVVITTLIAGDEVEIEDIEEPWVRVMTPLGSTGWVRTETIGLGGAPPEEPMPAEPAPPQEPPRPKRRGGRTPRPSRSARSAT